MLTRIRTLAPVILVAAVALTPGVAGSTVAAPVRPASVPRPQEVTAMQPTRVLDTRTGLGAPTEMLAPARSSGWRFLRRRLLAQPLSCSTSLLLGPATAVG